ncbi:3991_t:CDS:2 [Acaulospora morrowiae]|uniref:3991_t:CDS:1 n=1 Tax=Acaulospora morrowiae TaxID=94023 RepID=A0A9N8ZGE6_9GLOM|nr:3991_t:CDS:2 [Acaulospora morrowiae]
MKETLLDSVDKSTFTSTSDKENVEPDTFNLTDNLNSSNDSMRVESLNAINCTDSSETPSNDPVRVESFDATSDVYNPLDLCNKIPNLYRLLDLCKDTGSIGYSVDKIIISQEFLRKLCNDMVPNSFKSISEVNYASLNSRSLGLVGIYGNRETIARYLLQKNAIDEKIHDLLTTNDDENSESMRSHLKPGIYLLVENKYGFVIHWPEKGCYNNNPSQKKRNLVNLHRYLTELTNTHFCLMDAQELATFDFEHLDRYVRNNEEEEIEDDNVCCVYKLKFDNRDSREDELSLPSNLPPAMPIESCCNQSFITSYVIETKETHKPSGHASVSLNEIRNYNLRIDSSVPLAELIDLAEFLSIEGDLIKTYKDEMEMSRKDHEKGKEGIDNIIKVDADILFSILIYILSETYEYVFSI